MANDEDEQELPATEHGGHQGDDPGKPARATRGTSRSPAPTTARSRHEERALVEEMLKSGRAPLPGRDLLAGAGDRHGRDRPGDPDRVAEVGHPRAAAGRPRRPLARRGLEGPDLPQVPRRPARVRGRRPADAHGRDRGDGHPPEPPRRPGPAPGLDGGPRRVGDRRGRASSSTRAEPFRELSREQLENVLDMLDGRYPSERFAELRPRIVWDRTKGTMRGRPGARQLAIANAGTIPDRGLYGVHLPDGRRVGELDEEMVYEARPGQTFLLGATTWRIQEITRDRVIVTPAPGRPGRGPLLARRRHRPPGRAGQGDRRLQPRGGQRRPEAAREGQRPRPARRPEPRQLPAGAAGGDPGRPLGREHRRRALPRRDRRLAPVRALALWRPRPRRLGTGAVGQDPQRARPRGRRDLVGRRDRRPPARRRRAPPGGPGDARAGRARGPGRRRALGLGPVRRPLPRERRRARC